MLCHMSDPVIDPVFGLVSNPVLWRVLQKPGYAYGSLALVRVRVRVRVRVGYRFLRIVSSVHQTWKRQILAKRLAH